MRQEEKERQEQQHGAVEKQRSYIAIDLKSFYASVECRERGLDPLDANLVVADESRTDKTICLAVTPSLKSIGISGRCRLFEVRQRVREVNAGRQHDAPGRRITGTSCFASELRDHPELGVDFIIAPPRMAYYMEYSTRIYDIYMKYVAPEDVIVYSIDEVFMDVTDYLDIYRLSPRELAMKIILDVLENTGITATAGIGTNLYLCKVAMDIEAKHMPADQNGVRIAELDEMNYRRALWSHQPLTDFWRVGRGYARRLEEHGMFTIKAYRPATNSLSSGQVLQEPYETDKARLVLREMADGLALELMEHGLVTDQLVVTLGYDVENISDPVRRRRYRGEVVTDRYGRQIPKQAHGTINLGKHTASAKRLMEAAAELFDRIAGRDLLIRRMNLSANHVLEEAKAPKGAAFEQLELFTDYEALERCRKQEAAEAEREKKMQQTLLEIKRKFGKNAILRGMNFEEGATAKSRNRQIGGHRA